MTSLDLITRFIETEFSNFGNFDKVELRWPHNFLIGIIAPEAKIRDIFKIYEDLKLFKKII